MSSCRYSPGANARMVLMQNETFVREFIRALVRLDCPRSDFHRQELHILIAIVRVLQQCIRAHCASSNNASS